MITPGRLAVVETEDAERGGHATGHRGNEGFVPVARIGDGLTERGDGFHFARRRLQCLRCTAEADVLRAEPRVSDRDFSAGNHLTRPVEVLEFVSPRWCQNSDGHQSQHGAVGLREDLDGPIAKSRSGDGVIGAGDPKSLALQRCRGGCAAVLSRGEGRYKKQRQTVHATSVARESRCTS
jgi:hypothetical protein